MPRSAPVLTRGLDPKRGASIDPYVAQYTPGVYTFTPPRAGYWKFVGWGGGSRATAAGGGSGAYFEITRYVTPTRPVALYVGPGASSTTGAGDTTVVFANGETATAGAASNSTGGTATGGDVNLNGSNGGDDAGPTAGGAGLGTGGGAGGAASGGSGSGAGAPANLPFRGGAGGSVTPGYYGGHSPGGGAVTRATGGAHICAGDGLLIVMRAG